MRRLIIALLTLLSSYILYAQDSISINSNLDALKAMQDQISVLSTSLGRLQHDIREAEKGIGLQKESIEEMQSKMIELGNSLENTTVGIKQEIEGTKDDIVQSKEEIAKRVNSKFMFALILGLLLVSIMAIVIVLLKKRVSGTNNALASIRKSQEALQVESLKLDEKLLNVLESQFSSNVTCKTEDHSLVLKIADELARMETNLSRMDKSIRGYKQLSSALMRIKGNLSANGYEFVDMIGKPYHEGMTVDADFIFDDSLEDGQRLITGVLKPQINYNGRMIQPAKILVSQNC